MKTKLILVMLSLSIGMVHAASVQSTSKKAGEFSQENSKAKVTADSQMMGSASDVELTRRIRDRLTNTDSLSTAAQNVTIVTDNNIVTLKGTVEKEEEIKVINNIAQEYSGTKTIRNELKIKQ